MDAEADRAAHGILSRSARGRFVCTALPLLLLSAVPTDCGNTAPTATAPPEPLPRVSAQVESEGIATYYGRRFHGRMTASGIRFDQNEMMAAHPTYPFGTVVRVTNLRNGRSVNVRIVDRGPSPGARRRGIIIDVSRAAAVSLGFIEEGRSRVRLDQVSAE
jgi:rare lipoprotein A